MVQLSAGILCMLAAACVPPTAGGLVVNSTGDAGDSSPGDTTCRTAASATECTLRAAIEEANAWPGSNTITFDIPGGSLVISPGSALPGIAEAAIIDATTQPGYIARTNMATVDGSGITSPMTVDGLSVASGIQVTLKGLAIVEFPEDGIVNNGRLSLEEMVVSRNGGMGLGSSSGGLLPLSIIDSDFTDNGSTGIFGNRNDVTIIGGTVSGNGGGIAVSNGSLDATDTQILNNQWTALSPIGGVKLYHSGGRLTGVLVDGNDTHDYGGGIDFESDGTQTLTVADSTISNNTAYHGGGIDVQGGTVYINHSTLIDNAAVINGGGIRAHSSPSAAATLYIADDTAIGRPGHGNIADSNIADGILGLGGGIYSEAEVEISNSTIEGNNGDGINNNDGSLIVEESSVRGNSGDGIASYSPSAGLHTLRFIDCAIEGNTMTGIDAHFADFSFAGGRIHGNREGGLQMNGGEMELTDATVSGNIHTNDPRPGGGIGLRSMQSVLIHNSVIFDNYSIDNGGGLYIDAQNGTVYNATISGNRSGNGGAGITAAGSAVTLNNVTVVRNEGVFTGGILGDQQLTIRNSLVAENLPINCGGPSPFVSGGHNLDDGNTCGFSAWGDLSGVPALIGPLQDNGGPTHTHALLTASPALDAGDDATCRAFDQRYVGRPQGLHCDIGAYEAESTATATPTNVPTKTHTPTLTPTFTLDSDTFTKTPNPIVFDPVNFSSDMLWQGGESCGSKTLTVQVKVSPPEWVFSVGLFYRVVEKEGSGAYPWSAGLAMIPQGNGWYQLVLAGDDLPDTFMWEHQAWLDMQFAANDNDGQVIALSQVFRNVTLGQCYV